jgi:hypothetical protein
MNAAFVSDERNRDQNEHQDEDNALFVFRGIEKREAPSFFHLTNPITKESLWQQTKTSGPDRKSQPYHPIWRPLFCSSSQLMSGLK